MHGSCSTSIAVPTRSTPNTHLVPHIMDLLMDIPLDSVPSELKSACEQILKRAREVRKREPVVAYWCELGGGKGNVQRRRGWDLMGIGFSHRLLLGCECELDGSKNTGRDQIFDEVAHRLGGGSFDSFVC